MSLLAVVEALAKQPRNLALTVIHRTGSRQIAASRRTFAAHPERAFALLLPAAS